MRTCFSFAQCRESWPERTDYIISDKAHSPGSGPWLSLCAPYYLSCFSCLHFTTGTSCHSSLCAMPCSPLLFHSPGPQALFSYLANSSHVISLNSEEWFSDLQTCTDLCHHGDPLALLSLFGDLPTPLGTEALDDSDLWIPYSQSSVKNGLSVNSNWRNGFLLL